MTEVEMIGWHHRFDGCEFEQAPGVGDRQGSLACSSPWGHKESDRTEDWTDLNWTSAKTGVESEIFLCSQSNELSQQFPWCWQETWDPCVRDKWTSSSQSSTFSWASVSTGRYKDGRVTTAYLQRLRSRTLRLGWGNPSEPAAARFSFVSQGAIMFIVLDSKSVSCLWREILYLLYLPKLGKHHWGQGQCLCLQDTQQCEGPVDDDSWLVKHLYQHLAHSKHLVTDITTAIRSQRQFHLIKRWPCSVMDEINMQTNHPVSQGL